MKRVLIVSLAMNLVLGGVAWRLGSRPGGVPALSVRVDAPARQVVTTNRAPFHWGQVESLYYPVYIANLRAIGCPEQTINDIITADLKSVFDARRSAARLRAAPTNDAASVTATLDREEQEARRLLLPTLRTSGTTTTASAESSPTPSSATPRTAESLSHDELRAYFTRRDATDGQVKLLYADIDPTDVELGQLYNLSLKFNEEFGKKPPGVTDAGWEKRRRTALQMMEDQLRSAIGYPRFNEYLREAVQRGETLP